MLEALALVGAVLVFFCGAAYLGSALMCGIHELKEWIRKLFKRRKLTWGKKKT